ncbi:cAMP-dependent protein kinase type II-alpha regulatory subunit-like [Tachyglossus aculeatus]|uniref:cAMP-dependent protein kinase type II-alpha regulatory subunit-like n=1 Tax=Tachyglossus aculeatus TaxID=9261 RepID=UPI0018F5FEE0|nr:cAMP-dependent protein kinase type II-alpha regulatory subunit-like [Tachyglossus aculeatus]
MEEAQEKDETQEPSEERAGGSSQNEAGGTSVSQDPAGPVPPQPSPPPPPGPGPLRPSDMAAGRGKAHAVPSETKEAPAGGDLVDGRPGSADRQPQWEGMPLDNGEEDREIKPPSPNWRRYQRRASVQAEAINPGEGSSISSLVGVRWAQHPKSAELMKRLRETCEALLPFRELEEELLTQIFSAMIERKVEAQEHVVEQGEDGDHFYAIESGTYDILVARNKQDCRIGRYKDHGAFGELALMYSYPRPATIVAVTAGVLWGLDRKTFRTITVTYKAERRKKFESLISSVPFFRTLEKSEKMKLLDMIESKTYRHGDCIFAQGETADKFYIVESGEVKMLTEMPTSKEVGSVRLNPGQYFGEGALVGNNPRTSSAYAVGDAKCIVMNVEALERLLGPCLDILKRDVSQFKELINLHDSGMDPSEEHKETNST